MRYKNKAQIKLSFGMIFSIILIITFLSFGFWVIYKFVGLMNEVKSADFVNDLQTDIDRIWKSSFGSNPGEYSVPAGVKKVCFIDFFNAGKGKDKNLYNELNMVNNGDENMVFYPTESSGISAFEIKHLDIANITSNENPYCIDVKKGKVQILLKISSGESLVRVLR